MDCLESHVCICIFHLFMLVDIQSRIVVRGLSILASLPRIHYLRLDIVVTFLSLPINLISMTPFFIMCTVVNENERELSIMIYYIDAQMQELYHHQMRGNKKYIKI